MGRTNVVIDDELVERVMRLYGLPTKRAAIDFALRSVAGSSLRRDMLDLRGMGWEGDLDAMRESRVVEFDIDEGALRELGKRAQRSKGRSTRKPSPRRT